MHIVDDDTKYDLVFRPAMMYLQQSAATEGPGILCKTQHYGSLKLVASTAFPLQRANDDPHQRLLLCGVFMLAASHRIDICSVHFSLSAAARSQNARDVIHAADLLASKRTGFMGAQRDRDVQGTTIATEVGDFAVPLFLPYPTATIVVGDLNAEPEEESIQYLTSQGGFIDALHRASCASDDHDTSGRCAANETTASFTFDARSPLSLSKRIDYVLVKERNRGVKVTITSLCHRGCNSTAAGGVISDHVALVADIEIHG